MWYKQWHQFDSTSGAFIFTCYRVFLEVLHNGLGHMDAVIGEMVFIQCQWF